MSETNPTDHRNDDDGQVPEHLRKWLESGEYRENPSIQQLFDAMNPTVIDERQVQIAHAALRSAQTFLVASLAKNPDDADLNEIWTWVERALKALGCEQ